jgi:predicted metal-dependent peptidase
MMNKHEFKDSMLMDCLRASEGRLYDFVDACDVIVTDKVPTMGVSAKGKFYVNPEFYEKNHDFATGLILHESLHVYFDHVNCKYPNHKVANVAQDIIINDKIAQVGYVLPQGCCTYEAFEVPRTLTTSVEVYEFLMERVDEMTEVMKALMEQLAKEHDFDSVEEMLESMAGEGKGQPQPSKGEGKPSTKDDSGDSMPINVRNAAAGVASEVELQLVRAATDKWALPRRAEFLQSIERTLGRVLKPDFTRTFSRPRRFQVPNTLLPASRANVRKPKVALYLDVSGSMSGTNMDMAMKVLADLKIPLGAYTPSYFTFNTDCKRVPNFDEVNVGGGTSFDEFHSSDNADVVVVLTDCEMSFDFLSNHKRKAVIVLQLDGSSAKSIDNCEVYSATS